jgi:hypothetical protein
MWYDIFKLFWYAFFKQPKDMNSVVSGPFMPDIRSIPDIKPKE